MIKFLKIIIRMIKKMMDWEGLFIKLEGFWGFGDVSKTLLELN